MKRIRVALAGNPNVGKSVIFNALTGGRQHVGNWPGKTIEKKEGICYHRGYELYIVDLPGIYSLTTFSPEELIARDYILNEKPDVVVNIVDASNLRRNLYLSIQLMELGARLIIALNKSDLAESLGYEIDEKRLEKNLGVPVVPTVATRKIGLEELCDKIVEVVETGAPPSSITYPEIVEAEIERIRKVLEKDPMIRESYNTRWLAIKLLEGDEEAERRILAKLEGG